MSASQRSETGRASPPTPQSRERSAAMRLSTLSCATPGRWLTRSFASTATRCSGPRWGMPGSSARRGLHGTMRPVRLLISC